MKKLLEKSKGLFKSGRWGSLTALALGLVIVTVGFSLLVWVVIMFLIANWQIIAVLAAPPIALVWFIRSHQTSQPVLPEVPPMATPTESDYMTVLRIIFDALGRVAGVLNLTAAGSYSELAAPARFTPRGGVWLFEYVALKSGPVDIETIKTALQTRIRQMLDAQEVSGITQSVFVYRGRSYPILCIDEVRDAGAYVQIMAAWASDEYCEQLLHREQYNHYTQALSSGGVPRDRDF